MAFDPQNPIVKTCLQGMALEAQGQVDAAKKLFQETWGAAKDGLEKFLAAYFLARLADEAAVKCHWLEKALLEALKDSDPGLRSVLAQLYQEIGQCYLEMGETARAQKFMEQAALIPSTIQDAGPFYHGTRADLQLGDHLTPGNRSNYQSGLVMNHVYFTALPNGAGLAAALAQGDGRQRVYIVEPLGAFEHDPNVTDKKFPGNLTRSYRTLAPLRIVGELENWDKQSDESVQAWRDKLAKNQGEIIN